MRLRPLVLTDELAYHAILRIICHGDAARGGSAAEDIAEKVGLDRSVVTKIINRDVQNAHEPTVNATTPSAEIESLQRKLEEAEGHCGEGRAVTRWSGKRHCERC